MLCTTHPPKILNYSIIHLEMINIFVALKVWAYQWKDRKVRVKCDNMAVVKVLTSEKTKDATLGACAHNIWLLSALFNISKHTEHISGKSNVIGDLLSRYKFNKQSLDLLRAYVPNVSWVRTHIDLTCLNYDL